MPSEKILFDVREGEASVFKPDGNGGYKPIVRIQAGAWSEFAQDADLFLKLVRSQLAEHLLVHRRTARAGDR